MGERIRPAGLQLRMNHFPHDRISEVVFSFEMMKKRPFSRARLLYDAIEAAALKTVSIKFFESGFDDFSPGIFGSSNRS